MSDGEIDRTIQFRKAVTTQAHPGTTPESEGKKGKSVPQTSAGGANISAPLCLRPAGAIGVSDKKRKFTPNRPPPT